MFVKGPARPLAQGRQVVGDVRNSVNDEIRVETVYGILVEAV
jgi:hypothetical protein